ncbi:MAG TPA: ABC transporter ATP-binding protein [Ktedonobacterales bacterium]|jgi:ATP-binding cassette, subfamily B, bacterial|nr:ABC transporter ATP-binding protein [Ktedonobacterales bacterium]
MMVRGGAAMGGGGRGSGRVMRGQGELPARKADAKTIRRVAASFRPYVRQVAIVLVAIILVSVLGVVNPIMLKLSISVGFYRHRLDLLAVFVAVMVATPIISSLIGVGQTYLNAVIGQRVMRDLRNQLYSHLQRMPLKFFTDTRTGEIQSRLSNDIGGVQNVVTNTATSIVSNITTALSTVIGMLVLSWQLTLLSLGLLPLFLFLTYRVGKVRREISKDTQATLADLSAMVEETLSVSGVLLTKTFGQQSRQTAKFKTENERLSGLQIRQQMVGRWFFSFISTFFSILPALVYLVEGFIAFGGGHRPTGAQLADIVGTLVAFTTLQSRLYFPIGQLLSVQVDLQGAFALFDRIFEYLDMRPDIEDKPGAVPLDPATVRGEVAFHDVTFRYAPDLERPTLDHVSFTAEPGQLVALVGPSGAGKTTITYLIPRLWDAESGAVLIDGEDVRDVTLESLGAVIGVVTQETYLFHTSVRENLRYAKPDATDAELEAAARAAAIHDRIAELPEGYDTVVGERGYKLSGGEKQRVALARVILKDPRILILDEATSALDTHSERLIQAALERVMENRTTIAIAHRLSTILAADQILVVQAGRIVERGTHAELLTLGGLYARLYEEQFAAATGEAGDEALSVAPLDDARELVRE